jgi:hypothetical protein
MEIDPEFMQKTFAKYLDSAKEENKRIYTKDEIDALNTLLVKKMDYKDYLK